MPEKKRASNGVSQPRPGTSPARPAGVRKNDVFADLEEAALGSGEPLSTPRQGGSSWIKQNPNVVMGAAAGGLLLILLLLGWQLHWFGGGEEAAPAVASAPQRVSTAPTTAMPAVDTPPSADAATPPSVEPTSAPAPAEASTAKDEDAPLPEDVAKWKREDYLRARRQNDNRLMIAVSYLGEKSLGSDEAAQTLAAILKPLPPPVTEPVVDASVQSALAPEAVASPPGASMPPVNVPGTPPPVRVPGTPPPVHVPGEVAPAIPGMETPSPDTPLSPTALIEIAVQALAKKAKNGSKQASKSLEDILSGAQQTDDDRVAVEMVLKALLAHPCEENEALALRAIVSPESLRQSGREGAWPPNELRTKAFELFKASASPELRVKLATLMLERFARLDANDPVRQFLLAPDPLTADAQVLLYEKGRMNKDVRTDLEKLLADYSSSVLTWALGIPDNVQSGTSVATPPVYVPGTHARSAPGQPLKATRKSALHLATLLWSEKFRGILEPQLSDLRSLENQSQLATLAATLPLDSTRAILARILRKHYLDGSVALEANGMADQLVTDPGLLVLVKMLPRVDPRMAAKHSAGGGMPPIRVPGVAIPGRTSERGTLAERKSRAEQDWTALSAKLANIWCSRFHAAAVAKEKAAFAAGKTVSDTPPKLPNGFEPGPDARVAASYQLIWPEEAPASIAALKSGLLKVQYVRIEELNKPKKAIAYYGRPAQVRSSEVRTIDQTIWLDKLKMVPQVGQRSFDVLIRRSDGNTMGDMGRDDDETDLVIEVLVIEVKDPTGRD
jgi:hypothetical protein